MSALAEGPYAMPRVVAVLSLLLKRVSEHNDGAAHRGDGKSAFRALSRPSISVRSYLERIFRYANCSPSCYVVAYVYLDRFMRRHPSVLLDSFNVHRLLITSVLVAVKFMDDIYYNNAYFAKVGGISLMEMNYLEVDFLFGVGFELNVTPAIFASYCSILQNETYNECPPLPKILCSLPEEEPSNCSQKQLPIMEVFGT